MPISNLALQRAKPAAKSYKLADGGGLYLLVQPNGSRLWRLNYRFGGRHRTLALGVYPSVDVGEARERREAAKKMLRGGVDPGADRRRKKAAQTVAAANSFRVWSAAYQEKRKGEGLAATTLRRDGELLARADAAFGDDPVSEVRPSQVLAAARKMEREGHDARRFRSTTSRVFRFAIASDAAEQDPAAPLGDALLKRPVKNHASPKDPKAIGALMRAVAGYEGHALVRLSMLIGIHTFVRPGELRMAEWSEIDLAGGVWRISAAKMKMDRDHIVPLSRQVVGWFQEAHALSGAGRWVFPSILGSRRPMSDYTVNAALRRLGYTVDEVTGHGFRSMASTVLNESGRFDSDWIERQLAHVDRNKVRGIYNAAQYLESRRQMLQWYSDHLDELSHLPA